MLHHILGASRPVAQIPWMSVELTVLIIIDLQLLDEVRLLRPDPTQPLEKHGEFPLVEDLRCLGSAIADIDCVPALKPVFDPEHQLRFFANLLAGEEKIWFGWEWTTFDLDWCLGDQNKTEYGVAHFVGELEEW